MGSAVLRIRLLGELAMHLGDAPLAPVESARARSLLAYLLLHRDAPQPRQRVAFLLWPDSTEAQARTNLRHLLHNLRKTVPELASHLELGTTTLRWRPDAPIWLDVAAFEAALARAGSGLDTPSEDGTDTYAGGVGDLREAAELYRGDLLPGCYDEWIAPERDRLRRSYLRTLQRLAELLEERGDTGGSLAYAEALLEHDPFDEATYRLLMRLHFARGERARALQTYASCARMLEQELGLEPSTATRELHEALLQPEPAGSEHGQKVSPPFVGRAAEWERVTRFWRACEAGRTQLLLVTGEAGIGKTRLVEELRSWCAGRGVPTAEARSYRAEGALAYAPVAAWLRSDTLKRRLAGLDAATLSEIARLLPELLAEIPALPRPDPIPERDRRTRLFAAIARAVVAAGEPLMLVADDLHWADDETLDLLHHLLRIAPHGPLLLAATARREEMSDRHPLAELLLEMQILDRAMEIELPRLDPEATAALGERLSGRRLDGLDADRLYGETEGNPLFIVEALRAGWTGANQGRGWSNPRVQAVIRSRLLQLTDPARELAGIAATIGREFTTDVLAHASGVADQAFATALDELWRSRIVRECEAGSYDFSHDKVREVAYNGLSPARRRQFHLAVAQALERLHAGDPGAVSAQIAGHLERAGHGEDAIGWYEAAAEAVQKIYASGDAVRLLDSALELLAALPDGPARQARELALLTAILSPLANAEGFASPRLWDAHGRAMELARRLGTEPSPQLLGSMAIASLARDDFETAQRVGERLHARAVGEQDDRLLVESHYILGIAAFWQGQLEAARRHFEAAATAPRPAASSERLLPSWLEPQVISMSRLGNTLWFLGDPDGAVRARDGALALAEEIGHVPSRAVALAFAALLALEMEDTARLREYAAALEARSEEHDTRPTLIAADLLRSYLRVVDGHVEDGLAHLRAALLDPDRAEGAPGLRAVAVRVLMAGCAAARDVPGLLWAADRMLAAGGTGRLWESEARRVRAECLIELGAPASEAIAELERSIQVIRDVAPVVRIAHRRVSGAGAGRDAARATVYARSRKPGHLEHRFDPPDPLRR